MKHNEYTIRPSTFIPGTRANKRALFIGINYTESNTIKVLANCVNDAKLAKYTLEKINWIPGESRFLHDYSHRHKPTRANIIKYLQWLVDATVPGDVLFLHISAHGVVGKRVHGIVPYDYDDHRLIITKQLFHRILLNKVPKGATLYIVFDTCHSGDICHLSYKYSLNTQSMRRVSNKHKLQGNIVMLSSCQKQEKSDDGNSLSIWVYDTLRRKKFNWYKFCKKVTKFHSLQRPQITSSRRLNLESANAFHKLTLYR